MSFPDRLEFETNIEPEAPQERASGQIGRGRQFAPINQQALKDTRVEAAEEAVLSDAVQALIQRCLDGSEPIEESEKNWAWEKIDTRGLSPAAVNMAMLRAAGFKPADIAKMMNCNHQYVTMVCHHPYGKKIIAAIIGEQATKVIDIRTRMEQMAGDLLELVYADALKGTDTEHRAKVTFALLDRAGYGPKQITESKNTNVNLNATATDKTLSRLAKAMEDSALVDAKIMPTWKPVAPPDQIVKEPNDAGQSIGAPVGSSPAVVGTGLTNDGLPTGSTQ